jgi:hypothetical protein
MKQSDSANTNGTDSTDGTDGTNGANGVSPESRRKFLEGAKVAPTVASRRERAPWDGLDPDAPPDKAMNLKTNAYERAVLRAAAAYEEGGSMQGMLRVLIREGALARIERARAG